MQAMTTSQPGDRPDPQRPKGQGRLAEPPSNRYAPRASELPDEPTAGFALTGPLARALLVALGGAVAVIEVAAVMGSTIGLLALSGVMGAAIGLLLARAAVPRGPARPVRRTTVTSLAIVIVLAAIAVADVGTWIYARQEGGTLGLLDYLWTTFGPFVPGEAVIGALAAAWGANAGPVQG
jgi:hypothetical protein